MQSLIPREIRPVIKHSAHISKRGCSDASTTFAKFAYTTLSDASVLGHDFALEDFSVCDFLPQLQQILYSTGELDASVTYDTFVVVPENITVSLHEKFGNETEINGPFVSCLLVFLMFFMYAKCKHHVSFPIFVKLLDHFGYLSLRRFFLFFRDVFIAGTSRRRLERSQIPSSTNMRGALMQAVRQPDLRSHIRELQCGTPLLIIDLNEYTTITFDFNFGGEHLVNLITSMEE